MNLLLDKLRLKAQVKNISDYETNLKKIKVLSETKPKPEPRPKIEIKVERKKQKNLEKIFMN